MVIYTLYTQGPRFVESHICQNRADTRISCTRSQKVPRVRLSLMKAAWSSWKPTSFSGNTGYGAPVIGYGLRSHYRTIAFPGGPVRNGGLCAGSRVLPRLIAINLV